jgi:hypothetical protein
MSVRFSAALRLSLHERFPAAGRTLGKRVRLRMLDARTGGDATLVRADSIPQLLLLARVVDPGSRFAVRGSPTDG